MWKYLGHRFRTSNEKQILIVTGGERKASVTLFPLNFLSSSIKITEMNKLAIH